ncbi:MAG: hypothetical protein ACD_30C00016G0002 [uncultured bacterium]|uniref:Uncharacterized protein n=4 Tax=Candidatus Daviesiibacteriota TaxID=1752718 RepID=A0A0G0EVJ9_9BACT|nr:MAG: hypothetical protein ACD_30C00016G0002 [uncultured bacterium]KKQ09537.1 MAG: hypothetical protein US19_C0013G0011 [Candidatus Daviesbacteria bacterium GW2011_GWB1_36_5]KKQ15593.1 MAG: hypothetical protein US28_C0014G0036 [Candidatus Daviesbacteria bacterium GW2011_GWA1_36_8]OGE17516.1 MAG: hypothetical protein A2858_01275 [Candidatus Daviesbacteria bacterium RIFCSPHIGHO2_01_FULL_36_37]OGE36610.1 MAG: hypothetical protein A3E66_03120 [Candidatus Daviesbacteria bacterium RIFCSPHIGHO2_12_F
MTEQVRVLDPVQNELNEVLSLKERFNKGYSIDGSLEMIKARVIFFTIYDAIMKMKDNELRPQTVYKCEINDQNMKKKMRVRIDFSDLSEVTRVKNILEHVLGYMGTEQNYLIEKDLELLMEADEEVEERV